MARNDDSHLLTSLIIAHTLMHLSSRFRSLFPIPFLLLLHDFILFILSFLNRHFHTLLFLRRFCVFERISMKMGILGERRAALNCIWSFHFQICGPFPLLSPVPFPFSSF